MTLTVDNSPPSSVIGSSIMNSEVGKSFKQETL
jgi:hypothetical protein